MHVPEFEENGCQSHLYKAARLGARKAGQPQAHNSTNAVYQSGFDSPKKELSNIISFNAIVAEAQP